jgi:hypothetical protein
MDDTPVPQSLTIPFPDYVRFVEMNSRTYVYPGATFLLIWT